MKGFVRKQISEQGIAEITFYHPHHNALPTQLLNDLEKAILQCRVEENVKVILLKSEGDRTFCAGANFDELISIADEVSGKAFFMGFAKVIDAMRTCEKIIVTMVQGKAVGGGLGLCAASDYVLANKWASVRLSELSIGIGPFVIGPAVQRKIGLAHFSNLTLNPEEWQTAEWGKQVGLFQEVFKDQEQLEAYVATFVNRFTKYNPAALKEIKSMLWSDTDHWPSELSKRAATSGRLVNTEYVKQSLLRFKQGK